MIATPVEIVIAAFIAFTLAIVCTLLDPWTWQIVFGPGTWRDVFGL